MTRYDRLLDQAAKYREDQQLLIHGMDVEDSLQNRVWLAADFASDALWMAQAEQQRIANLLTVALDRHASVMSNVFPRKARAEALKLALQALGLPTDEDESNAF
jgi:hypothetical protein